MGGGTTRDRERQKSALLSARGRAGKAGSGGVADLSVPLCERERALAFRVIDGVDIQAGSAISVVRADPPAVVVGHQVVGYLSDRRQAATVAACLDEGYRIAGEVQAVDSDRAGASAIVAGVRVRP
jgi:hypothetical protein